jgi:hypothetical protein
MVIYRYTESLRKTLNGDNGVPKEMRTGHLPNKYSVNLIVVCIPRTRNEKRSFYKPKITRFDKARGLIDRKLYSEFNLDCKTNLRKMGQGILKDTFKIYIYMLGRGLDSTGCRVQGN